MNNELICEYCNSRNIRIVPAKKVMMVLAELQCEDCGEYFKLPSIPGTYAIIEKTLVKYDEGEECTKKTINKVWIEIYNERLKESLDYLYNKYLCLEQVNEENMLLYKRQLERVCKIYCRDSIDTYTKIYEHME